MWPFGVDLWPLGESYGPTQWALGPEPGTTPLCTADSRGLGGGGGAGPGALARACIPKGQLGLSIG